MYNDMWQHDYENRCKMTKGKKIQNLRLKWRRPVDFVSRSGADQWISRSEVITHSRLWYHYGANDVHQRSGNDGKQFYDTLCRLSKINHTTIILLRGSGRWDFRFSGFGHFWDRFFGFCTKNLRFWYLLRFAVSALFRSPFPVFGINKIGIRCGSVFFRFLFGKYEPKWPQRVRVSSHFTYSVLMKFISVLRFF